MLHFFLFFSCRWRQHTASSLQNISLLPLRIKLLYKSGWLCFWTWLTVIKGKVKIQWSTWGNFGCFGNFVCVLCGLKVVQNVSFTLTVCGIKFFPKLDIYIVKSFKLTVPNLLLMEFLQPKEIYWCSYCTEFGKRKCNYKISLGAHNTRMFGLPSFVLIS